MTTRGVDGRRLRLTFAQAIALSLVLHAAAASPFALGAFWPQEEDADDTLVVELDGIVSDSQLEEKKAAPEVEAVPPMPQPPPPPPRTEPPEAQAAQAPQENLDKADEPVEAPPSAAVAQAPQPEPQATREAAPLPPPPPPPHMAPSDEAQAARSIAREKDDDEDALRRYGAQLAKKVQSRLIYPAEAQAARAQGVVKIAFALRADGSIERSSLRVIASSGSPSLDAAALATIRNCNPYPPPPKPTAIAFSLSFGKKK